MRSDIAQDCPVPCGHGLTSSRRRLHAERVIVYKLTGHLSPASNALQTSTFHLPDTSISNVASSYFHEECTAGTCRNLLPSHGRRQPRLLLRGAPCGPEYRCHARGRHHKPHCNHPNASQLIFADRVVGVAPMFQEPFCRVGGCRLEHQSRCKDERLLDRHCQF